MIGLAMQRRATHQEGHHCRDPIDGHEILALLPLKPQRRRNQLRSCRAPHDLPDQRMCQSHHGVIAVKRRRISALRIAHNHPGTVDRGGIEESRPHAPFARPRACCARSRCPASGRRSRRFPGLALRAGRIRTPSTHDGTPSVPDGGRGQGYSECPSRWYAKVLAGGWCRKRSNEPRCGLPRGNCWRSTESRRATNRDQDAQDPHRPRPDGASLPAHPVPIAPTGFRSVAVRTGLLPAWR